MDFGDSREGTNVFAVFYEGRIMCSHARSHFSQS